MLSRSDLDEHTVVVLSYQFTEMNIAKRGLGEGGLIRKTNVVPRKKKNKCKQLGCIGKHIWNQLL